MRDPGRPADGLHILILTDRDWTHPQGGGTGTNLLFQVRHWLAWGHRVSVISCGYPGAEPCVRDGALTLHHVGGRSTVFPRAILRQARGLVPDADVVLEVINGITFLTPLWLRTPRLALVHEAGVPEEPDVLSIDVDGNDIYLWQATRRRPRLLVIEYNGSLPPTPEVRLAQPYSGRPWDGTDRFGASLGALEAVSARKGYVLVHTELAGVNAFFVPRELADDLPTGDAVPRRASSLFLSGHGHRRSRRPGGLVTIPP